MKSFATLSAPVAIALILGACEQPPAEPTPDVDAAQQEEVAPAGTETVEDPTPGEIVANGVFVGRSGKPMVGARLVLGTPEKDDQFDYVNVKLPAEVNTAVADAEGRFQFKGFTPGEYTIAYKPAGGRLFPSEMRIRTLVATMDSIAPLLIDVELGTNKPFSARSWGRQFTLLEGHTLFSEGAKMKIQNATVRYGREGPFLEVRERRLWTTELKDNSEIQFEAWSY